jgi:hypothetical protein
MVSIHFHNSHHPVFEADEDRWGIKGKAVEQSVYWYWWKALRRSEKYKLACAKNGAGMQKLYDDFGDVFSYKENGKVFSYEETAPSFKKWWYQKREAYGDKNNNLGAYLFGEPPLAYDVRRLEKRDLGLLHNGWDAKQQALLTIPLQLPKAEILRRIKRELDNIPDRIQDGKKQWRQVSEARYKVADGYLWTDSLNEKGSVWNIRRALELYDAHNKEPNKTKWKLVCELDDKAGLLDETSGPYKRVIDLEEGTMKYANFLAKNDPQYKSQIQGYMDQFFVSERGAQLQRIKNETVSIPKRLINKCAVNFTRRHKLAKDLIAGAEQGIFPQGLRKHGT